MTIENEIQTIMKSLIARLNEATVAYDKGEPTMSDREWDDLYFELQHLEKKYGQSLENSPTRKIHFEKVSELKKVKHSHPMLSLDKTKDIDVIKAFFGNQDRIAMCKMDGLTCSLIYENGRLISAETRGDGTVGEDITHNALVIPSIPNRINYSERLVIDGEIVCTYYDFENFKDEYKNPRNFASGSIRLLDSKECANRKLTFVAWDVIEGMSGKLLTENLQELNKLGFNVVPITVSDTVEVQIDTIKDFAKVFGFPIDGVVFKFNDIEYGKSLGATDHHFKNAIAYKFYDETYSTRLITIDWTMGRTGVLTPVAIFEPIEIDGTVVERASLHNYSVMKEVMGDCAYVGQKIEVFKANQIIPQIKSALKMSYGEVISNCGVSANDEPEFCPICQGATAIIKSVDGVKNMVCDNPNCEGKLINRIDHYCSKKGLDIKGLSKATLEKLIDWGWVSNIQDIYNLEEIKEEWISKPGFGVKSVNNILSAIEESKKCKLENFISAIGIPLIGRTVSKELVKYINDYDDFKEKIKNNYDFADIEGFGPAMNKAIHDFDYTSADAIYYTYLTIEQTQEEEITEGGSSLEGMTFVITGKLKSFKNRDELKAVIENKGGKVAGSVSKNTNYLINNDNLSTTAKNKKAQELGIPIITEETFKQKFLTI